MKRQENGYAVLAKNMREWAQTHPVGTFNPMTQLYSMAGPNVSSHYLIRQLETKHPGVNVADIDFFAILALVDETAATAEPIRARA